MSVYKPKNSRFYLYDFQLNGRRFHGTTGRTSRREAEAVERDKRREAALAAPVDRLDLNSAAGRFWIEKGQFDADSATTDYRIERVVAGLGPATALQDITENDLARYVADARERRSEKLPNGPSNASINRELQIYRRIWRRAKKVWKVPAVPEIDWAELLLPEADERVRELSAKEEEALFAALRPDHHPISLFCLITGVRQGNAIALEPRQCDFDAGVIHFRTKSKKPGGRNFSLPMIPLVRALLQREIALAAQHGVTDRVFTYEAQATREIPMGNDRRELRMKGRRYPFTKGGLENHWKAARKASGLTDFRFHDLRHTAATRALRASNLKVVQQLLNHASIKTTAKYAHAVHDDLAAAMQGAASRKSPELVAEEDSKSLTGQEKTNTGGGS